MNPAFHAPGKPALADAARRPETKFRFHQLQINGEPAGSGVQEGLHDGHQLWLHELKIADAAITRVVVQDGRLSIAAELPEAGPVFLELTVLRDARPLLAAIQFGLSRRRFEQLAGAAAADGRGRQIRRTDCPWCSARIFTLDGDVDAPQVWCEYCDSLVTLVPVDGLGDAERYMRLCPVCNLYSRPRRYTIAWFYFLVHHAGIHQKVKEYCTGCLRPDAWKMLLGNIPGVLGVPFAMMQWYRAYRNSFDRGPFRGLDKGNITLRRKRQIGVALKYYERILNRHPYSAGVLYNVGVGLLMRGDGEHARQALWQALENCSNYRPAQNLLARMTAVEKSEEQRVKGEV
jgi:hypothetical protein